MSTSLEDVRRFKNYPGIVAASIDHAQLSFLEFFATSIRNPHTRHAHAGAVGEFLAW